MVIHFSEPLWTEVRFLCSMGEAQDFAQDNPEEAAARLALHEALPQRRVELTDPVHLGALREILEEVVDRWPCDEDGRWSRDDLLYAHGEVRGPVEWAELSGADRLLQRMDREGV